MKNLDFLVFVSALLTTTMNINAQVTPEKLEQKTDSIFSQLTDESKPGSAVLVVKDGAILLNKGYGLASLEFKVPIGANTVFDVASVSKQFLGFAISSLVEQNKISLTDEIHKYIHELSDFGHDITIDHLVHHVSGIRDWTGTLTMAGWSLEDIILFDQILRMTYNQKELNFIPGEEFQYSNTGYNLLAEVVQRVTGLSFRAWTHDNIFEPLEMNDSFFLDDLSEVVMNKASSYELVDDVYHLTMNNTIALGSSSLNSTTTDLAKWVLNLNSKVVGGEAVINRMFKTSKLNDGKSIDYAYGFWVGNYRGTFWVDHTGGWASFRTYLTHFPDQHLSVVILNNGNEKQYNNALAIANFFIPEGGLKNHKNKQTRKNKAVMVDSATEDEYVGTYKFGHAWYVHITKQGSGIYAQETGNKIQLLTPVSKTSFSGEDFGNTLQFKRNKQEQIMGIEYKGKLRPRLSGFKELDLEKLSEYVGDYYSNELKSSFTVTKDGDVLILNHIRRGESRLIHAFNDDFLMEKEEWIKSIEFVRDNANRIKGFKATEGGARNQMFMKI